MREATAKETPRNRIAFTVTSGQPASTCAGQGTVGAVFDPPGWQDIVSPSTPSGRCGAAFNDTLAPDCAASKQFCCSDQHQCGAHEACDLWCAPWELYCGAGWSAGSHVQEHQGWNARMAQYISKQVPQGRCGGEFGNRRPPPILVDSRSLSGMCRLAVSCAKDGAWCCTSEGNCTQKCPAGCTSDRFMCGAGWHQQVIATGYSIHSPNNIHSPNSKLCCRVRPRCGLCCLVQSLPWQVNPALCISPELSLL